MTDRERVASAILLADSKWAADPGPHRWGETIARAAIESLREFDTSEFTFTEAEAIRRFLDDALK